MLGVLYGAGPVRSLDRNRIFARWLQKRVNFTTEDEGEYCEGSRSHGPDRQLISMGEHKKLRGRLGLYAEDGRTLLGTSGQMVLQSGRVYVVESTKQEG